MAISSPLFFCVYIDELFARMQKHGDGCWIGPHYLGAIGYADDITLLCPTLKGLKHMIQTCLEFGNEYDMTFNPQKSMCVKFGERETPALPDIKFGHNALTWQSKVKHLGNIRNDMSEESEIFYKRCEHFGFNPSTCPESNFVERVQVQMLSFLWL